VKFAIYISKNRLINKLEPVTPKKRGKAEYAVLTLFFASWYAPAHAWAKSGMSDEPTGRGSLGSESGETPATAV
jgi:hypothetical protein